MKDVRRKLSKRTKAFYQAHFAHLNFVMLHCSDIIIEKINLPKDQVR